MERGAGGCDECRAYAPAETMCWLAASRIALGLTLAMANKVLAAPLGCLRPCSQPCKVRMETPKSAAN